jgi:hypothetical protein
MRDEEQVPFDQWFDTVITISKSPTFNSRLRPRPFVSSHDLARSLSLTRRPASVSTPSLPRAVSQASPLRVNCGHNVAPVDAHSPPVTVASNNCQC